MEFRRQVVEVTDGHADCEVSIEHDIRAVEEVQHEDTCSVSCLQSACEAEHQDASCVSPNRVKYVLDLRESIAIVVWQPSA